MHCCSCNHTEVATVRGEVNISLVMFVPYPNISHNIIKVVTFYIPITSCHISVYCKAFLLKALNIDFRFL